MKAIGTRINGEKVEFDVTNGYLYCDNNQLKELLVPQGVTRLYCDNNQLKELVVPQGVTRLCCYNNQLKELVVPQGVTHLYCFNNQLNKLVVPQGVTHLYCDNNQLKENKITWRGIGIETIFVDGYTMLVERKHRRGSITILKCRYFGDKPLEELTSCYVAKMGEITAHGDTIDQAVKDLQFKMMKRKGLEKLAKQIKKAGYVTREQYHVLTGACNAGIAHFCEEHGIKGNRLSIKKVLELTTNAYGGEKFKQLMKI